MDSVPASELCDVNCTAYDCRYNRGGVCIVYRTVEPEPIRQNADGSPYTYTQCHQDMKERHNVNGK